MITAFDIEKLQGLLRNFYEISQIRITVFDENLNELVSYPQDVTPYCRIIRGVVKGYDACTECDRQACDIAAKQRETYVYRCHAGFTEAVTPLYVGAVLAGYLLFGHVFSYSSHEEGWQKIERLTEQLPINHRMLKDAVSEAVPITEDYIRSAAQILHAVASYVILEQMATLQADKLAVQVDSFLAAHFTEDFKAPELCEHFHIGKTQLYKISQQLYGCGIAEHVRDLRMALAKDLLTDHQERPLTEIAARCGYNDYSYFISVFTRQVGCPPGAYRKEQQKERATT